MHSRAVGEEAQAVGRGQERLLLWSLSRTDRGLLLPLDFQHWSGVTGVHPCGAHNPQDLHDLQTEGSLNC